MTTETAAAIETAPRPTWQADPIHRLSADNIAALRSTCAGRWLARLSRFGEQVWCEHDTPLGLPGPVIVQLLPEAGPSLAASAVGVFVNYAQRPSDGMRCGFRPEGRLLKTPDLRVACGVVERTWVDRFGVVGVIALWSASVHEDLRQLDAGDALAAAQLCLCFTATDFRIARGPWQLPIATVTAGRAFTLEFTALSHSLGSRIVRPLALDEEPDEAESIPSDTRVLPPRWSGLPAEEHDGALTTADISPGSVTTPTIATQAATAQTKTVNTGSTSKTPGSSSDISGRTATQSISSTGSLVFVDFQGSAMLSNDDLSNVQIVEVIYNLTRGDNTPLVTGAIRLPTPRRQHGRRPDGRALLRERRERQPNV